MTKITKEYISEIKKTVDELGDELKQLETDLYRKHKSLKEEKEKIERKNRDTQMSEESLARLAQLEEALKENEELIVTVTGKNQMHK